MAREIMDNTIKAMPRLALAIIPLLSFHAFAQQLPRAPLDPADMIEKQRQDSAVLAGEWMQSPDARTRAWGSFFVLRDRLTARIPDLLLLAQNYNVTGEPASLAETDNHDAMLAVLDSLIQMQAGVPFDTAIRLYPEFPAQAMILIANSRSEDMSALLPIFQTAENRGAWLTAGNLLVDRRAPGFAAAVFSGMAVHAYIYVTDGLSVGISSGGGFGGSLFSEPRAGWPEIGNYVLSACGATQSMILADGVHPAYYQRVVNNLYHSESDSPCINTDLDKIRADYLATLLSSGPDHVPVPSQVTRSITWTNGEGYLSELTQFIADQQTLFASAARRLASAGLMTESEASSSRPALEITVADIRQAKLPPLPNLPAPVDGVTFHQ